MITKTNKEFQRDVLALLMDISDKGEIKGEINLTDNKSKRKMKCGDWAMVVKGARDTNIVKKFNAFRDRFEMRRGKIILFEDPFIHIEFPAMAEDKECDECPSDYVDAVSFRFHKNDVIQITRTDEFECDKEISGQSLYEANACHEELERYIKIFGFYNTIRVNDFDNFMDFADEQPGWTEFLLNKNFIAPVETEVFSVGDYFRHDDDLYQVIQCERNKIGMFLIDPSASHTGVRYEDPIEFDPDRKTFHMEFIEDIVGKEEAKTFERIDDVKMTFTVN